AIGHRLHEGVGNQHGEIERKINELAAVLNNSKTGLAKITKDLEANLLPYGITGIPSDSDETEKLKTSLKERKDKWADNEKRKVAIGAQILTKQPEIAVAENIIKTRDREIGEKKNENTELLNLLKGLKLKREGLFGSRIPDDEERISEEKIAAAESAMNESADILKRREQLVTEIATRIKGYEEGIGKREVTIAAVRKKFMVLLRRNGFETEEEFLGSRMSADDRADLEKRSRDLEKEKTELVASVKAKAGELESEKARELTSENEGQLTLKLEEIKTEAGILYEEIVRKGGRLRANEEAKERGREIGARINNQTLICERWSKLSGLIGSADGKKYRNFAQSLTLELMVSYANSQLSKLSDRYLLVRNREEPLDLDVIDNYQAGEIRSTKNLSGGESFIVSLALALGLSHMAGRKVRIDSLFLDEGFGTLDEETLETALSTLASLRQDGKIIGVISHVGAMKERIGTKITVTPVREGRSLLSGPGCREVSIGKQ
ncbi:MAG TPA: SbcC/MukB-like Walker B domain-containing protein, partial [Bacteroidales bacterium]|nr:SbcC/MukB-like Walker B domain-containing protein [Bacteroidales bacterium]